MRNPCRVAFIFSAVSALFCMSLTVHSAELSKAERDYLHSLTQIRLCVGPNSMPLEDIVDDQHIGMNAEYMALFRKELPIPIKLVVTQTWKSRWIKCAQGRAILLH